MDSDFRDALREVDFESLTKQWSDTPFRLLIQEHVRETDRLLESAIAGIVNGLRESELEAIRLLINLIDFESKNGPTLADVFNDIAIMIGKGNLNDAKYYKIVIDIISEFIN